MSRQILYISALMLAGISQAYASEMVYEHRSPTFGGNPNNASYLQYTAGANNQHKDDGSLSSQDDIADLVRRSVSFQLANNINDAIFGDNPLGSGTSSLGDGSSITWQRDGSLVTVTFIGVDGTRTSFIVPD